MMPLYMADTGEENVIRHVGGSPEMKKHLEDMGFTSGSAVTVLNTIGGNLIVKVRIESGGEPRNGSENYDLSIGGRT